MATIGGRFDIVVANPPYIAAGEIGGLDVEVRAHDPRRALDGGADGLAAFRAIIAGVGRVLAPRGAVFLEIGMGQGESVAALARAAGFARALGSRSRGDRPRGGASVVMIGASRQGS